MKTAKVSAFGTLILMFPATSTTMTPGRWPVIAITDTRKMCNCSRGLDSRCTGSPYLGLGFFLQAS